MIDFRYHIASLMAVFLALGIGILIGNSFVGLASVEPQIRSLQRDVQENMQASRQETETLRHQIVEQDRAIRTLAPRAVAGVLTGRRIALVAIERPSRPEMLPELTNLLATAGAEVVSTTLLRRRWLPTDPPARARVLRRLGLAAGESDPQRASAALADALVSGDWSAAVRDVESLCDGIHLSGSYATAVGGVVLIDSAHDSDESLGQPTLEGALIDAWKRRGIRVVAAEPESTPVSRIAYFRARDAATVDNIDSVVGEVACAMALSTGTGNYGTKATADRVLPDGSPTTGRPEPGPTP